MAFYTQASTMRSWNARCASSHWPRSASRTLGASSRIPKSLPLSKSKFPMSKNGSSMVRASTTSTHLFASNALYFPCPPVIRAGLLSGKLSQTTQTLRVVRATARAFERPQWEALEQRLTAWRAGLESVLEVVASAKKRNTQVLAAVAAEGPTNDAEGVAAGPAAGEAAAGGDVPPAPQPQVVAA